MGQWTPWEEGRRAWARLDGWFKVRQDDLPRNFTQPDPELRRAMAALADLRLVRDLLGQAEFAAVQDARRLGQSWADIGAALGITRQSAWERWHEDEDAEAAEGI